jgi:hypothetical protein
MKNNTHRNFAMLFAAILAFSSCASTKIAKDPHAPYLGNWDYAVEEFPMDIDGTLIILKTDGVLKGTLSNPMGEGDLDKISIKENIMKAEIDADGNLVELEGTFTGNTYLGSLLVMGAEYVMKMEKQE